MFEEEPPPYADAAGGASDGSAERSAVKELIQCLQYGVGGIDTIMLSGGDGIDTMLAMASQKEFSTIRCCSIA